MQDQRVKALLDFGEPVAVLMFAILHFLPDAEQPYEIVRRFTEALPQGSALALSHITGEEVAPQTRDAAIKVYEGSSASISPRPRERIAAFFDGLDMASPGLVNINLWPDQTSDFAARTPLALYGGVA